MSGPGYVPLKSRPGDLAASLAGCADVASWPPSHAPRGQPGGAVEAEGAGVCPPGRPWAPRSLRMRGGTHRGCAAGTATRRRAEGSVRRRPGRVPSSEMASWCAAPYFTPPCV